MHDWGDELGQRDSCKMGELEAGIHSDPVPLSPEAQRLKLSSLKIKIKLSVKRKL